MNRNKKGQFVKGHEFLGDSSKPNYFQKGHKLKGGLNGTENKNSR